MLVRQWRRQAGKVSSRSSGGAIGRSPTAGAPGLARSASDAPDDPLHEPEVVKWIPLVVPLFALLLALCVFLIGAGGAVLRPAERARARPRARGAALRAVPRRGSRARSGTRPARGLDWRHYPRGMVSSWRTGRSRTRRAPLRASSSRAMSPCGLYMSAVVAQDDIALPHALHVLAHRGDDRAFGAVVHQHADGAGQKAVLRGRGRCRCRGLRGGACSKREEQNGGASQGKRGLSLFSAVF